MSSGICMRTKRLEKIPFTLDGEKTAFPGDFIWEGRTEVIWNQRADPGGSGQEKNISGRTAAVHSAAYQQREQKVANGGHGQWTRRYWQ